MITLGFLEEIIKRKISTSQLALVWKILYLRKVPAADAGLTGTPFVESDSFSSTVPQTIRRFHDLHDTPCV
jgi:hypothetical protein